MNSRAAASGFANDRQSGSHPTLWNEHAHRAITIPVHPGKDLGRGLVLPVLKTAAFTAEDFLRWRDKR